MRSALFRRAAAAGPSTAQGGVGQGDDQHTTGMLGLHNAMGAALRFHRGEQAQWWEGMGGKLGMNIQPGCRWHEGCHISSNGISTMAAANKQCQWTFLHHCMPGVLVMHLHAPQGLGPRTSNDPCTGGQHSLASPAISSSASSLTLGIDLEGFTYTHVTCGKQQNKHEGGFGIRCVPGGVTLSRLPIIKANTRHSHKPRCSAAPCISLRAWITLRKRLCRPTYAERCLRKDVLSSTCIMF
jgi:hypothetical protein